METNKKAGQQQTCHYVIFTLESKQFALPLEAVQRVVNAAAVTTLPKAPEIVAGLVNYRGNILPVIDISRRFHLPEKKIEPQHYFVIVHSAGKGYALVADKVEGLIAESSENITPPTAIMAGMEFLAGIMKLENGLMLIPDLDKLLTHEETLALKKAVQKGKRTKKNA
jgi:purine-binding chemotaxis protein CheW